MSKKICTICKHLGQENKFDEQIEAGYLYNHLSNNSPIKVGLCRKHSVQLFRSGQKKFLIKYRQILNDLVNTDEMEFIKLLDKTVRENYDSIY